MRACLESSSTRLGRNVPVGSVTRTHSLTGDSLKCDRGCFVRMDMTGRRAKTVFPCCSLVGTRLVSMQDEACQFASSTGSNGAEFNGAGPLARCDSCGCPVCISVMRWHGRWDACADKLGYSRLRRRRRRGGELGFRTEHILGRIVRWACTASDGRPASAILIILAVSVTVSVWMHSG